MKARNTEQTNTHSSLYWLVRNLAGPTRESMRAFFGRHKRTILITLALILTGVVIFRPIVHPFVILVRAYLGLILLFVLCAGVMLGIAITRKTWKGRAAGFIALAILVLAFFRWGGETYYLVSLHALYNSLPIVKLQKMALTDHERVQPYVTVVTDIQQLISGGQEAGNPTFVRIGPSYFWTTFVGPGYWWGKLFGSVTNVKIVSGTGVNPEWRDRAVNFGVGEQLYLSHDTHTCVIRSLGPLRFWSFEPAEVKAMVTDAGEVVQVVSLTRWSGIDYRPDFGGVVVIREGHAPLFSWAWMKLFFTGCGEWIPPGEITRHAWLRGQNVVPSVVGRFMVESFRFKGGFVDPLWGFHIEDIRIPSSPEDQNEQPIVQYLHDIPGEEGKLYQTYSLEPFNPNLQGFSLAVMIPGDNTDRVYIFEPQGLTGVSAIAGKVKASNTIIDWNNSFPAEKRWFVRDINGQRHFFIYTSVVTRDVQKGRANAGVTSEVPVTDARGSTRTFWMKEPNPALWTEVLTRELGPRTR